MKTCKQWLLSGALAGVAAVAQGAEPCNMVEGQRLQSLGHLCVAFNDGHLVLRENFPNHLGHQT